MLTPQQHAALLIRRTEERLLALFSEGRVFGTVHTCIGQEWVGIAVAEHLGPDDLVFSNHRCHGHYLARTDDVEGLIAEVMGKSTGVCGGRGGSQHLCKDGFFSNGILGGMTPIAAGMALGRKLRADSSIAVIFAGDGAFGEGILYETLNIVSKWQLPFLMVVENNQYAQSTQQNETLAGTIMSRADSFGIATRQADTWNPAHLVAEMAECIYLVRDTCRPLLIQVDTYRLSPHSKGDDTRDTGEIETFRQRDPVGELVQAGDESEPIRAALTAIDRRIEAAVGSAAAASVQALPSVDRAQVTSVQWDEVDFPEERAVESISRALEDAMERDSRVVLLGEDIKSPYGGAFKVTRGLSDRFPDRVLNTPISEASIVGIGTGLAMQDFRPIVEIMFGDFLLLASDQIVNHAAKFRWMYNDQVTVPLIIRTPMGGRRGYGPTHSQCLEKHLLGVPDTQVLALHHRYPPALVYEKLLETIDRPTLVLENKILYGRVVSARMPSGFILEATQDRQPTVRIRPLDRADITIIAYGGMALECEAALQELFDEHEVLGELIIPLQVYPLVLSPILESARATQKVLVVEEGQGFAAFGSELIAQLAEQNSGTELQVKRVAPETIPIPASRTLELLSLPSSSSIARAALGLFRD